MKSYTKAEVDAVLALFNAFGIEIGLETNPIMPLTIYTNLYKWSDGSYHDSREPEDNE